MADGITAMSGQPITAVAGRPIANAVFATYTVTDPSGEPGTQWRALINFGDGHGEGPIIPVEKGAEFEFVDTHTYNAPGIYTVTVMIAVPGSQKPNDNTVTTRITVTSSTPTPTPTPPSPRLVGSGISSRGRVDKAFRGNIARFSEPHTNAKEFDALISWGDPSVPARGVIHARGRGRFVVGGSHHYAAPGVYQVTVNIRDGLGQRIVIDSSVRVVK
jgi:hypothetical protein